MYILPADLKLACVVCKMYKPIIILHLPVPTILSRISQKFHLFFSKLLRNHPNVFKATMYMVITNNNDTQK